MHYSVLIYSELFILVDFMQKLDPKSVWLFFFPKLVPIFCFLLLLCISVARVARFTTFGIDTDDVKSIFDNPSILFLIVIFFLIVLFVGTWIWVKLHYNFYRYELR